MMRMLPRVFDTIFYRLDAVPINQLTPICNAPISPSKKTRNPDTQTNRFNSKMAVKTIRELTRVCSVAAPVFSKTLKSVEVAEGVALVLECHVTGTPLPEISWYRDTQQIGGDSSDVSMGDVAGKSRVRISELRPEHSGEYVCRASNVAGESLTSANIRVVRKCLMSAVSYDMI